MYRFCRPRCGRNGRRHPELASWRWSQWANTVAGYLSDARRTVTPPNRNWNRPVRLTRRLTPA